MPEIDDDLALLKISVEAAGDIARKHFGGSYRRWTKSPGNPVTEADIEIDSYLKSALRSARPDYGWLSEETEDNPERLTARHVFVVDPIDGTVAFLKGKPHFTICAAVIDDGEPVAGVVFNPISQECFSARRGAGAICNGQVIRVSHAERVENCRMLADRTIFQKPMWQTPPLSPWPTMQVENRNSVAYRLSLVANGTFDAALSLSGKSDWDLAAADLIVREAGGKVTDHRGASLRYNGPSARQTSFVAAGPALHVELISRVKNVTK